MVSLVSSICRHGKTPIIIWVAQGIPAIGFFMYVDLYIIYINGGQHLRAFGCVFFTRGTGIVAFSSANIFKPSKSQLLAQSNFNKLTILHASSSPLLFLYSKLDYANVKYVTCHLQNCVYIFTCSNKIMYVVLYAKFSRAS